MKTEVPVDADILDLVPGFLTSRQNDLLELQKFLTKHDGEAIARQAHTIKGIARPYGFPTLESLARELEDAALKKDWSNLTTILTRFESFLHAHEAS